MPEKLRERKYNKENYKRKQIIKRRKKEKREKQAISRKYRNEIRKSIRPYFEAFRKYAGKNLLFVMKDTENMECILLQEVDLGNGRILLTLPVITEDMINEYLQSVTQQPSTESSIANLDDTAMNDLIEHYYSVRPGCSIDNEYANIMVLRECKVTGNYGNLVPLTVRPYNVNKWYSDEFSTLGGFRIYKGNKLTTFFKIDDIENYTKTFIFHDTIAMIIVYKAMMGKIKVQSAIEDLSSMSKKRFSSSLYQILATDFTELFERFKNEKAESDELNKVKVNKPNKKSKYVDVEPNT